jgi:two-component system OmpR family response regulator
MDHHHSSEERGNVLIVEDDNDTAEVLTVLLANAGYGVRKVSSRDMALQVLRRNLYRCIVLDFYMPGLTAEEFMEALKTVQPNSRVVLITAAREAQSKADRLGLRHFVGKPFLPSDLLAAIGDACSN